MELLVSVRDIDEAAAAVAGGAGIIDGKEPAAGALGRVTPERLQEIAAVAHPRLVTAALGDASTEDEIERAAATYARSGAALVKIGFAGAASRTDVERFLVAASRGATRERVIAVAYADYVLADSVPPADVVEAAIRAGVRGVLLDSATKAGAGTLDLYTPAALRSLVSDAKRGGLLVAMAGKLGVEDLRRVEDLGADVAGVRGAACEGGRNGRVTAAKVRDLCARLYTAPGTVPRSGLSASAI